MENPGAGQPDCPPADRDLDRLIRTVRVPTDDASGKTRLKAGQPARLARLCFSSLSGLKRELIELAYPSVLPHQPKDGFISLSTTVRSPSSFYWATSREASRHIRSIFCGGRRLLELLLGGTTWLRPRLMLPMISTFTKGNGMRHRRL